MSDSVQLKGNIFTIKHGNGVPDGKLQPYELGFDETGKKLYIGGVLNNGALGNAIPIAPTLTDLGITASVTELNKMDGVTATTAELNVLDGITATTAELNYCDGVTSNIQTQLNGKQASITGGASTITGSNLTANCALISNGSGKVAVSAVTSTELGYLDGVTSAIQTQLNGKQASITGAASTITSSNLTASRALVSNSSGKVAVSDVTSIELGYLDGVTSAIQTQLNGKMASPTLNSNGNTIKIGQIQICFGKVTFADTWVWLTFPTSFGATPCVVITPHTNNSGSIAPKTKSTSTTGCYVTIGGTGSSAEFSWIAVGKAS